MPEPGHCLTAAVKVYKKAVLYKAAFGLFKHAYAYMCV